MKSANGTFTGLRNIIFTAFGLSLRHTRIRLLAYHEEDAVGEEQASGAG